MIAHILRKDTFCTVEKTEISGNRHNRKDIVWAIHSYMGFTNNTHIAVLVIYSVRSDCWLVLSVATGLIAGPAFSALTVVTGYSSLEKDVVV